MRMILIGFWLAAGLTPDRSGPQETPAEVAGVVRFTGAHKPRLMNAQVDGMKHGVAARDGRDVFDEDVVLGLKGELANVLVRVKGPVPGEFAPPKEPVELDAAGCFFKPRVVALRQDQTLRVKCTGLDRVNVHAKAKLNTEANFNILRDTAHDLRLSHPENGIRIQHDCCPWMVAWVHVLDHPFFSVTGADGAYRIKGLPAGTYEIEAWHEKFGTASVTVTVGAKEVKAHNFQFERAGK
jgi:hypothetical protein